ncbi:MAG: glycerol-3-phosphate acyltransferase [Christensenellales bacterium]
MNDVMKLLLTLIIGYLLGSISTGVILSRVFGHKDIRNQGSGNSGTTNMLRVMGKKFALLTFAGDLLKGIIAVLIGKALLGTQAGEIVGAFGAILGHNFPLYFGFKGGKGIATSFGCLLIVFPLQTLCAFGVILLLVATTRYV